MNAPCECSTQCPPECPLPIWAEATISEERYEYHRFGSKRSNRPPTVLARAIPTRRANGGPKAPVASVLLSTASDAADGIGGDRRPGSVGRVVHLDSRSRPSGRR